MCSHSTRQFVRWTGSDGKATLVVERPPLNALSYQAKEEIGAGRRAFAVGSDLKDFPGVSPSGQGRPVALGS